MNARTAGFPLLRGLLGIGLFCLALPVGAQAAAPPICGRQLNDVLRERIEEQMAASVAISADQLPATSPASQQTTAPSGAGGAAATLVNGANFPGLLAFAIDNGLLSEQGDLVTGDFNLFDLKAIFRPEVLDRQTLYQTQGNQNLRRWGIGLTFGGKGDSFDRDGDGKADPALEAKNLGDIVNWELRYRLYGTRDRRDRANVDRFKNDAAINSSFDLVTKAFVKINGTPRLALELEGMVDAHQCIDGAKLDVFLKKPEVVEAITQVKSSESALDSALDRLNQQIDTSLIVTAFVGGLERKTDFGPSKRSAGFRLAKGTVKDQGVTLNAEYTQTRSLLANVSDPSMLALRLEYGLLLLKDTTVGGQNGVHVALSGAYEKYDHVPDALHDTVAKLNAKLELHLSDTVKIPISVTWANHPDLLSNERDIRGHIGFSIDLTNPLKPKKI